MSNTSGSSTVEQRIVEMRIDNEKFEAGAKKTIGILESLDRSLKSVGQDNATGFDNIESSLEKVTDRFSAMGIIGDQVMRNLTNKAMELVGQIKNMATMLTTQQIDAGWNKYADKTQAIQTIMAATSGKIEEGFFADQAEQLEWVNEQIEKLNKFTDETSYNFLDMVGNIGKFTAAGRELEESVTAMEGIANWAAISGGRPAEAGRAMYNLSQALGMGAVTTIDWKSIENANMATYEFKQQAIDAAVAVGTLRKVTDGLWETVEGGYEVTVENFRNSLSFGRGTDAIHWFNGDVLLKVLNNYGEFADKMLDAVNEFDHVDTVTNYLKYLNSYKAGGLEQLQKDFDLTQETIDEILPSLEEFSKAEYDLGFRAFQAAQEAKTFTEAIDATKDAVSTKWMTVFELLFGNYLEAKELWTNMAETFWNIFAQPIDHLIDIISGARGVLGSDGLFYAFSGGMEEAAGSTAILEDRLLAIGKTMDDFRKALNKTMGAKQVKQIVDDYGSLEEALKNGAISIEQFKKALGALDDAYDSTKPISLNRALNKARKTMTDFEKAIEQVGDRAALDLIEQFGSVEEALKRGGISAELFKKALESLGIDSENVSETVEQNVQTSVASLEEMRQLALEVLRGDHGNGNERLAWYKEMGLDAELMQAMAGDLKNMGYYISDESLMAAMESYYQYNNLAARLGYETFAEYLNSIISTTEETVYDMNQMADEADDIYASLFGVDVLDEYGEYISAGKLFRESLTNLLEALKKFGAAFDKAFMKVFGGSDDYDKQVGRMSDGFFTLTVAFNAFSKRVLAFSKSETFLNFATAFFSIIRLIGKVIGVVFKIAKTGLSFVMKLLSPILNLLIGLFDIISTGLDAISRSFEDLGIIQIIDMLGDILLEKISKPIDKINYVIGRLIKTFKDGFANGGGITGGIQNVSDAIDILFQNHPVFLTVVHTIAKAIIFLKDALEGLALVFGSVFGGAIMIAVAGFQKLGEWFGEFVTWAQNSELLSGIWQKLTETFQKFGRVIKRVYGYAEKGYQEGGFIGALTAIADSFERGVTRLVPGGEKLVEIFHTIKDAIRGLFTKRIVNEDGVEEVVDQTDSAILKLEEIADRATGILYRATGDEEAQEGVENNAKSFIAKVWSGILAGLRDIRISDVIGALRLGVIADFLLKVGHGINIFNDLADNISDVPGRLVDMFKDLGQMFRSLSFDIKANAILKFAVAAGIVAGAIWILSKIPDAQLEKASSVVIAILAVLSLLAVALGKTSASIFQTIQYMPALGAALIGFAAVVSSIGMTALILTLLAKFVGVEELKTATNAILTIVAAIVGMIAVMIAIMAHGKFNAERIKALGSMLRSMGLGLMGIALAVRMLMLPVLAFSLVLKFARGSAGIKKFWMAVGAVGAIIVAIGALVWIISQAANGFTADQINQLGTFLIKVAASLVIIAFAISMLTTPILILSAAQKILGLNVTGIVGAFAILGVIGLLIALILAAFGGSMSNKSEAQIKAVGNYLLKFAASLVIIALAVALMTAPIIKIAELCDKMSDWHVIKSLGILIGTITILAVILGLLGKLVFKNNGSENAPRLGEGLLKIAKGIALLALAGLLLTPAIILLTAAIAGFSYVLGNMSNDTWKIFEQGLERLGKFSTKLMLFGAALMIVGLAATLTGVGTIAMAAAILILAAALGVIMLTLPFFVKALDTLKDYDWKQLLKGMGAVLLIVGTLTIATVMLALGLIRLSSIFGGGLFGRAADAFATSLSKIVTSMRTGISNGFTRTIEFLKKEENKEALIAALQSIILVGAAYVAGILPTLAHVVVGGIVGLLNAVASEVKAQAPEIVEAISNIVSAILDIAKGLVAKLFGEESWSEMSWWQKGIAILGGGLFTVNKVAGLFSFGKAEESAETLSDKIFGVAEKISETKDKIETMKDAFNDTKAAVSLLVETMGGLAIALPVVLAIAAAAAFAYKNLQAQQNILEDRAFNGQEKTLEGYNSAIEDTEKRIAELKEQAMNGLDTEMSNQELQSLELLLKTLVKEREELEKQNAATEESSAVTKENNDALDTAAERSEKFASNSRQTAIGLEETATAAKETTGLFNQLKDSLSSSGLDDLLGGTNPLDAIKEALSNQGIDINDLIKPDASGFDTEKFKSLVDIEKLKTDLYGMFDDTGLFASMGLSEGALAGIPGIEDAMGSIKDGMLSTLWSILGIESPSEVMANEVGVYIPAGIGLGISRNQFGAVNPLYNLLNVMHSAFANVSTSFQSGGANIVQGLINGIAANLQAAYDTGANLASTVERGFRQRLRIESPSKVFRDLAGYIPEGVSEGINGNQGEAIQSVVVLGDALLDAITKSMAQVAYVASDDFTISPQITPVVDLSNVNAAAGSMGSLFGGSYKSYVDSVNSRAANISSATEAAAVEVRANNEATVSEMRAMGDRLDALGERITNMQIVLDTGVMVGSMSNRMDSKLGQISARRNRAN